MNTATHTVMAPRPMQALRRFSSPWPDWVLGSLGIGGVLLVWLLVTANGLVNPEYLPSLASLADGLMQLVRNGYKGIPLHEHIGASLGRTLAGFGLGACAGVAVGLFTGSHRVTGAVLSPLMAFLRPIPPIAFIPMSVLYFGLGEMGKVVLIFFTAFNYAQLNAHMGAASIPIAFLRAGRSMGLTPRQVFLRVVVPATLPQIMTGLKVALALSWAVVVAAELAGAQKGLGFMISDAAQLFQIPTVFLGIALIGAIGLLLNLLLGKIEHALVHWRGH